MAERGISGRNVANVTHHLKGIDFPAKKDDLISYATEQGADEEVLKVLRDLPDREYGNMADVMQGYGQESR
ncbi:MAG: DUF2795 domain-containing protein [Pseudomonadota bacterium]